MGFDTTEKINQNITKREVAITAWMGMTVRNLFCSETMEALNQKYETKIISYYSEQLMTMWPNRWSENNLFSWSCPRWRLPKLQGALNYILYQWNLHAFLKHHPLFTLQQRLALYKESHPIRYYFDREVGSRVVNYFRGKNKAYDLLRDVVYLTPLQKQVRSVKALLVASTDLAKDQQLIYTCRRIGTPVVALVHSFDNLTSKGLLSTKPDRLLVWNDIMRKEAVEYHSMDLDKIDIVGVPQYEQYRKLAAQTSKERFRKRLKIPNDASVITYTASAMFMFPDEERFVQELVEAISRGECGNSHLVLRTHPPDVRKEAYLQRYSESHLPIRIDIPDAGYTALHTGKIGTNESILNFVELMQYSDVVVNLSSTIALDAVLFNTPVICLNFNYLSEESWFCAPNHHRCEHYWPIVESNAVDFPNNLGELICSINSYLDNPEKQSFERRRLMDQMMPKLPTSSLVVDAIEKTINEFE